MAYQTINLHFTDLCNYRCTHCFVHKENHELTKEELTIVVQKINKYFKDNKIKNGRINLAGGEPLLSKNIDFLIDYIHSFKIKVSLITNGYYLTKDFILRHKDALDTIGISVDSLNKAVNKLIGRCHHDKVLETDNLIELCDFIKQNGIKLKINTCVSKLNYQEDFTKFLERVKPDRYKVLEMLCEDDDLINLPNRLTSLEFLNFVRRHEKYVSVSESSTELKASYLIIDSLGNISSNNLHKLKYSIFDYEINDVINLLNINHYFYDKRYQTPA